MEMASSRRHYSQRIEQVTNGRPPWRNDSVEVAHGKTGYRIRPVQPDSVWIGEEDMEEHIPLEGSPPELAEPSLHSRRVAEELTVADEHDEARGEPRLSRSNSVIQDSTEDLREGFSAAPLPARELTAFPLARRARTAWSLSYADHAVRKVGSQSSMVEHSQMNWECFMSPVQQRESTYYEEVEGDFGDLALVRAFSHRTPSKKVRANSGESSSGDIVEEEPQAPQVRRISQFAPQNFRFAEIEMSQDEHVVDIDAEGENAQIQIRTGVCHPAYIHKSPRSVGDEVTESTAENSARSMLHDSGNETSSFQEQAPSNFIRVERVEVANDFPADEDISIHEMDVPQIVESYPTLPREVRTPRDYDGRHSAGAAPFALGDAHCIVDIDSLKDAVDYGGEEQLASEGEVILQVYALSERTQRIGLPIFHLGVEVNAEEHFYTLGGVDRCVPTKYSCQVHSHSVPLGRTTLSRTDIGNVVEDMKKDWLPNDYAFLGRNCQDFAVEFCRILGVVDAIPFECVRFANMSDVLPPLVISGLREADRKVSSFASMIGGRKPVRTPEEIAQAPKYPSRLGFVRKNDSLSQVVLPLENEETLDL